MIKFNHSRRIPDFSLSILKIAAKRKIAVKKVMESSLHLSLSFFLSFNNYVMDFQVIPTAKPNIQYQPSD